MERTLFDFVTEQVEYRGIPGLPDHQVGSDGSMWTKSRFGPKRGERRGSWRRMSPSPDKDGYLRVAICHEGITRKPMKVHACVLGVFVGPCPEGMEACHGDGNPANNRLDNLRWDTPSANNLEKRKHGTDQSGERHGQHKLFIEDVRRIRSFRGVYGSQIKLAREYGIHRDTVRKIWNGTFWRGWE
jgi:hypothetical protein